MERTAKIVREIRAVFSESQAQFAQRLQTSQPMVARWEKGQTPTPEWLAKLHEVAMATGLENHATELMGLGHRPRVRPSIEVGSEEEIEYVNALLRVLRRRDEYRKEFAAIIGTTEKPGALERPRKDNDSVLRFHQKKVDLIGAIIRLHQRGSSSAEIAAILGGEVTEQQVSFQIALHLLHDASETTKEK